MQTDSLRAYKTETKRKRRAHFIRMMIKRVADDKVPQWKKNIAWDALIRNLIPKA